MAEEATRRALGRGLAALIGEVDPAPVEPVAKAATRLPVAFLQSNPRNPRQAFPEDELEGLAASIREKGLLQPILVRPVGGGRYEIIAGERRWRAAQKAGLHDVPVLVREVDDREVLELAIVENVQRSDLNAIEEAGGYQRLMDEFGYSQGKVADVVGKSRPHIANTLRLLKLPGPVQAYVRDGRLSAGHARALLGADDPLAAAERVVNEGLTVRAVETLAQRGSGKGGGRGNGAHSSSPSPAADKDPDTRALEKALSDGTGFFVDIRHRAEGAGEVRIAYETLEQLDDLCRRLQAG